ncbi:MAG: DUF1566 domain-containing protein [Acidobacteria bacterium]|nr:DUF1566 domain-containing protein [Acidobacteriota bacterium]
MDRERACAPDETTPVRRHGSRIVVLAALSLLLGSASCSGADRYEPGDTGPGGGTVYYVADEPFPCGSDLSRRCTTLEAAPIDADADRTWAEEPYVSADVTGAGRTSVGAGWANTLDILAQGNTDPAISAAAYADAYEHDGYDDWYLPSKDEIFELYDHMAANGTLPGRDYWSSTEYILNSAWTQHAGDGPQYRRMKIDVIFVRPVRAF